jgi:hypothetical protein
VQDFSASLVDILQYYIWLLGRPADDSLTEDSQDSFGGGAFMEKLDALQVSEQSSLPKCDH